MEKLVKAYTTHIEISPYAYGEYKNLEIQCSTNFNYATHKREEIGFRIEDRTLFIPRGISLQYLADLTNSIPGICSSSDYLPMKKEYKMKVGPKNEEQKEAIEFLIGEGRYQKNKKYSQLALNVKTSFGKTYCAIFAMVYMARKTMIIVHRNKISEQWISSIKQFTTIDMKRVCIIHGAGTMDEIAKEKNVAKYDVYIVLQSTLNYYMKINGYLNFREWMERMQFGLKIIDEVHYGFEQNVVTDLFSNVDKNFYLSATFSRSDRTEIGLFKRVFSNTPKYGDGDIQMDVIYNFIYYNSNPSAAAQSRIKTYMGVSASRFADYAFKKDTGYTIYDSFFKVLKKAMDNEGRIIIVIPKIEYCERIAELIRKEYIHTNVGTIHSKNSKKKNEETANNSEIIVSTISSLGTGVDIKDIRTLIVMEIFSSPLIAQQLIGRLRKYKDLDSYVYELVDCGFDSILGMINKREGIIKSICKEVNKYRIE